MAITIHPEHFAAYKAAYHALRDAMQDPLFDHNELKRLQAEHIRTRDVYTDVRTLRDMAANSHVDAVVADESPEIVHALKAECDILYELASIILDLA